jgi:hypothetical protein
MATSSWRSHGEQSSGYNAHDRILDRIGSLRRDLGQLFSAMDLDRLGFSGSILRISTYSDSLVHGCLIASRNSTSPGSTSRSLERSYPRFMPGASWFEVLEIMALESFRTINCLDVRRRDPPSIYHVGKEKTDDRSCWKKPVRAACAQPIDWRPIRQS